MSHGQGHPQHHLNFDLRIAAAAVVIVKAAGQLLENSFSSFLLRLEDLLDSWDE